MKSLNRHVPLIVFLIGFGFLIYSVRTLFHPTAPLTVSPFKEEAPAAKPPASLALQPPKKAPPPLNRTDSREEMLLVLKRPALEYLKRVGLRMSVPDGFGFAEETDGPVEILIGASEAGRPDFYLFTAKGKYTIDKVNQYIKQYFADEGAVTPKGTPQSFRSRSGFSDILQLRGTVGRAEYQAYFFSNSKSGQSHLLFLTNRQFSKAPAKLRELIDSLNRAAH